MTPPVSDRLKQLHELHQSGVLTADEFASEKAKLLGTNDSAGSPTESDTAPAAAQSSDPLEYSSYDEVPFFRQNWFMIVCFFFFWPAIPVVVATGNVYYVHREKGLTTYTDGARIFLGVWGALVTVSLMAS